LGPSTVNKKGNAFQINVMTMIDLAIGLFELVAIKTNKLL